MSKGKSTNKFQGVHVPSGDFIGRFKRMQQFYRWRNPVEWSESYSGGWYVEVSLKIKSQKFTGRSHGRIECNRKARRMAYKNLLCMLKSIYQEIDMNGECLEEDKYMNLLKAECAANKVRPKFNSMWLPVGRKGKKMQYTVSCAVDMPGKTSEVFVEATDTDETRAFEKVAKLAYISVHNRFCFSPR
ncbi:MAG: hypothetical protein U9M89_01990 [Patescibacteria group bacterium]|nr:hypothetical protein [Patescibacteria group bacterium]